MVRYQFLGASRSGAHQYQAVNFFHLVVVLASVKTTEEMCIRCYYLDINTSERSYSRGYGGGVCPQKAPEGPALLH